MLAVTVALALLVGAVLGLLGGGGSILMLPVLVYVAALPAGEAISTSLLVVGSTSAAALMAHARAGRIAWKVGLLFGGAGIAGATAGGFVSPLFASEVLLAGFGATMVATAARMLRGTQSERGAGAPLRVPAVLLIGSGVGFVAGLVGAGGGFLVVPALVLFGGLNVRTAVGTSLLVISMQSFGGFLVHLQHARLDAGPSALVTLAAVTGSIFGARVSERVSSRWLRRSFAWLVLAVGSIMLIRESLRLVEKGEMMEFTTWLVPLAGGALIGLAGALLWLSQGRVSGISGIAGGLSTAARGDQSWRLSFLLGLLGGGAVLYRLAPGAFGATTSSVSMTIVAGALVGIGTTLANGCTSGHGVCGVSRLSKRSLVATATFVVTGALSTYVVHHLLGGSS